ncbi:MAG TPA: DUF1800 domain-containing protein [Candidatus Sulfotelmatobacter sp.]
MRTKFLKFIVCLFCLGLGSLVPSVLAKKKDKPVADVASEQRRAVHALNRLTFGPRPGDVQQVMAMGVDRWIDEQLHPEKISDTAMDARLAPLRTLHMSTKEIVEEFPDPQILRLVMDGKKPMPSDPARRAIYQVQIARLEQRLQKKQQEKVQDQPVTTAARSEGPSAADGAKTAEELAATAANDENAMAAMSADTAKPAGPPAKPTPEEEAEARRREDSLYADLKIQSLIELPAEDRYRKIMAMSKDEQIMFAESMRGGRGQEFVADMNPKQKETLLAMNNPQGVVVEELAQAKLLRAIYSERQLEEVMTDFWFNHFNVFVGKGQERLLLTNYEQDVIRPHALGKFEDLLVATAKSPAMLFYLDNWLSVGPNSMQAQGIPPRPMYGPYGRPRRLPPNQNARINKKNSGLNENYGRELLELHTLSVTGGYSQRDVTEVAKVFTGWTIDKPFDGMTYRFDPRKHEPGPKFVLGKRIKPNGEGEGREVLHMLATSPQTAHFICLKLAQRFVADDPPAELVDRMAKTFEKKKGDIREVLATLFQSPEFWAETSYRAKVKTPLEFVASAVRATGADVTDALPLARQLSNMGMPLYGAQPPTGYSMKAETWVSSSALLNRMNFALALTGDKIRGVKVDATHLADTSPADSAAVLDVMEAKLLASDVSRQTHDSILQQTQAGDKNSKPPNASMIAGLLIGSPEFQRR